MLMTYCLPLSWGYFSGQCGSGTPKRSLCLEGKRKRRESRINRQIRECSLDLATDTVINREFRLTFHLS
jgi:hypothetical protein